MRLQKMGTHYGKPPLRTVSEIAEILGITHQQLMWALKDADAPKPALRASEASHCVTGNNKVWYEPKAVLRWYRARPVVERKAGDPEKRREYHREWYRKNRSAEAVRQRREGTSL